jgi:glucose-1-phosphate cytidylyltransferase
MERNEKVVILCGGKGTRSYPYTQHFPKVMMPISGTPIVVHLMRIFARQGFRNFVLSAAYRKEILIDYFDGRMTDWNVEIVDTGEDADTADRIIRCADYVGDTFVATYGDGLGNLNLSALLDFHHQHKGLATLTTVPLKSQYGLVRFDADGQVTHFDEKPTIWDSFINAGFFVFNKRVFEHWAGNNLEGDVLPRLAASKELFAYRHEGFWKSMDTGKDQNDLEQLNSSGVPPWFLEQGVREQGS